MLDLIETPMDVASRHSGRRDQLGENELTDAQWLRRHRQRFGMSQSNVVSYLEVTVWENVNPGRIAEIETGQRTIPLHWRVKLERLFEWLEQAAPQARNWRDFISTSEKTDGI